MMRSLRNSLVVLLAALLAGGAALASTTTALTPWPKAYFTDNTGAMCAGCLLFTYNAGTTTKLNTYTDNTGTTANANPIVLDSTGRASVWLTQGSLYKFVLAPSTDTDPPTNAIWTVNNIQAYGDMAGQNSTAIAVTGGTMAGVTITNGSATSTTLTDTINQEFTVSTADVSFTSNTTLATITGLSIALTASKTYSCGGHLTVTASGASGGIKVQLVASGGLTATSASFTAENDNGTTTNARSTVTALGSSVGNATAAVTDVYLDGAIVVNAAGTINVQAAQNASDGTTLTVGKNSTFRCVRVN